MQRAPAPRAPRNPNEGANAPGNWGHAMYNADNDVAAAAPSMMALTTGGKLLISNLDAGVTSDDLNDLFSTFGTLKKADVCYDKSGRSLGTGEVVFVSKMHAQKAQQDYNNVALDGKPMKIEFVVPMVAAAAPAPRVQQMPAPRPAQNYAPAVYSTPRVPRGGMGGSAGPNRGAGAPKAKVKKTAEQLDKELDNFTKNKGGAAAAAAPAAKKALAAKKNFKQKKTAEELDAEMDAYLAVKA
jgi:THO complex subunit 4